MENNGSKLSQDEIDALLKGGSNDDIEPDTVLSAMEQDAIGEIGNISFGSSATALSTLLNQKSGDYHSNCYSDSKSMLNEEFPHPYVAIEVNYTEGFSASNLLVVQQTDAAVIADLMMGGDGTNADPSLSEIHLSAVQEAMNQMMGSAATSMSTVFNKKIDISPPRVELLDVKEGEGTDRIPAAEMLVKVSFRLKIGELIDSNIMQLYPITFAKDLIAELTDPAQEEEPVQEAQVSTPEPQQAAPQTQSAPAQQAAPPKRQAKPKPAAPVHVAPVEFEAFSEPQHSTSQLGNLDMLMDIPLSITVELGRTQRSVKEVLELSAGSIIELDKLAGEPVDILVNKRIVAKGEVVVIDENFGVRVTDILSQSERLSNLK